MPDKLITLYLDAEEYVSQLIPLVVFTKGWAMDGLDDY